MSNTLSYALFKAHPASRPPFTIDLGFSDGTIFTLVDCQHIPDGVAKMEDYCTHKGIEKGAKFTLLYPIYLDAMGTDAEGTLHQIAWLIKDEADAKKWNFDRIGGYTNKTPEHFL